MRYWTAYVDEKWRTNCQSAASSLTTTFEYAAQHWSLVHRFSCFLSEVASSSIESWLSAEERTTCSILLIAKHSIATGALWWWAHLLLILVYGLCAFWVSFIYRLQMKSSSVSVLWTRFADLLLFSQTVLASATESPSVIFFSEEVNSIKAKRCFAWVLHEWVLEVREGCSLESFFYLLISAVYSCLERQTGWWERSPSIVQKTLLICRVACRVWMGWDCYCVELVTQWLSPPLISAFYVLLLV